MGVVAIKNVVVMTVVIALTTVAAVSESPMPNAQRGGSKWNVHVYNDLSPGDVLLLHCKSKEDDLGEQKLVRNQKFAWSFKENFWQTTLFWCYFSSPYGQAEFDVFWPEKKHTWLEDHCEGGYCVWIAKVDGIYLVNMSTQKQDYKHDWNKTIVSRSRP